MNIAAIISRIPLAILFLLCETLLCDAKPTDKGKPQSIKNDTSIVSISCPDIIPENIQRLKILDRIHSRLTPSASTLKEKTAARISLPWILQYLDNAPMLVGFPTIDSEGDCSVCNKINKCFRADCESLENLMILINNLMSSMYSKDIVNITRDFSFIRKQMYCKPLRISKYQEEWQRMDMEFRIAKDVVEYVDALQSRYANIY
ncbi:unnamed protein product [Mytilus coruscus]|uniref:Uncharacterized protein n=1 Tax=Mytilus coruscus TaxID=42192 RepID=A0A6J8CSY7_MYTCO|nr:unnamed protein product [Mytilus coruscus]